MKQQAEVYADLKAEAVSIKERDVERRMQQVLEEKLANLRAEHRLEVAKMVGRIQGANEAINREYSHTSLPITRVTFWFGVLYLKNNYLR